MSDLMSALMPALWPAAFLLTVAVELLVAVPLLGLDSVRPFRRRVGVVVLAQCATHPFVWFAWPLLGLPRPAYLLCAEAFAFAVELLIYRRAFRDLSWSRAFAVSALANGVSVIAGSLLYA